MVATEVCMSELFWIHPIVGQRVTASSNHATLLFYSAFIQKELHKPAYSVSEVDHTILLVLMQVLKWFHNLLVQVGRSFDFSPKTWVGPFDSHKHGPRKRSIDTAVTSIALRQMECVWDAYRQH
jgi:hypothetical protein